MTAPILIARTAWTDDDGSGTTGTVINNAVKTELYDQIDSAIDRIAPAVKTKAIDYTMLVTDHWVRFTTAGKTLSLPAVAGLPASTRTYKVSNEAASGVVTIDASGAETIFDCRTAKTVILLGPGETCELACDASRWCVLSRNGFVPRVYAYRNTSNQSINTSTHTKIQLNGEGYDRFAEFDSTTNYRFTAAEAMDVDVFVQSYFADTFTGVAYALIYLNGGSVAIGSDYNEAVNMGPSASWSGALAAGDYVEFYIFHAGGSAKNIGPASNLTYMTVNRRF